MFIFCIIVFDHHCSPHLNFHCLNQMEFSFSQVYIKMGSEYFCFLCFFI